MKKIFAFAVAVCLVLAAGAREPQRGYRGFVDWDNSIGPIDYLDRAGVGGPGHDRDTQWFSGLSTSHGYQINNHVFVGAGAMISGAVFTSAMIPVFAQVRYDYERGKFRPFADLRAGYNLGDGDEGGGVYLSPTVGYRCNWGRKANFNIGLGLTLRGASNVIHDGDHYVDPLFTLRFGFDW